jgi:hypothetical protein
MTSALRLLHQDLDPKTAAVIAAGLQAAADSYSGDPAYAGARRTNVRLALRAVAETRRGWPEHEEWRPAEEIVAGLLPHLDRLYRVGVWIAICDAVDALADLDDPTIDVTRWNDGIIRLSVELVRDGWRLEYSERLDVALAKAVEGIR